MVDSKLQSESRLPHRLAVLLVCAVFPLLWVGGLVTTTVSGMAVPDWPTTYGYNLFLYPWQTWLFGPWNLFIEHGHRLLGALVGLITIGLVVAVFLKDSRRWMRTATVVALVLVVAQGVLGGRRVQLDDRTLAMIHGCVGPAFFAFTTALAVMTSRLWRGQKQPRIDHRAGGLHRLAFLTLIFSYAQLVVGAVVRHTPVTASSSSFQAVVVFHLVLAVVLLVHVALLATCILRRFSREKALRRPALVLASLIVVQPALGVATWVVKYGWPIWLFDPAWARSYVVSAESSLQTHVITAHVATGSLILAVCTVIVLRSLRLFRGQISLEYSVSRSMMGVAA